MPFTFSHPALILPLLRLKKVNYSVTGLVVGSITPDFEYFIRFKKGFSSFSHSVPSLVYFNLPLGLCLALLFHQIIKVPILKNLPDWFYTRMAHASTGNWRHYLKNQPFTVVWCLLLGSSLHLLWDWITHQNASLLFRGVNALFGKGTFSHNLVYTFTHLVHSFCGLVFIYIKFRNLPQSGAVGKRAFSTTFWALVLVIACAVFLGSCLIGTPLRMEDLIVSAISAFLIGLVIACIVKP